jgi:hypothetical protein
MGMTGCTSAARFCTSPLLFHQLKQEHGTGAVGTVRTNRVGLNKDTVLLVKDSSQGDSDSKQGKHVTQFSWMDKKVVNVLSTVHGPLENSSVNRKQKNGTIIPVDAPKALEDYNANMGGGGPG